ncbi:TGACG-sequence-specific DNA-binding protein TGA-2.1 [Hordeum vulgare]|nr:TGACG-sequence-specific DNA-binding protein TGA-2.1 [Hordeum vulgare]
MEASQPSPVTVEVAHAQSPSTDLVDVHVAPVVAQGTNAPARKRQGNVVVHDDNLAGPARKARASDIAAVARSARPPTEKVSKVSDVKQKKVPMKRSTPSSTPSAPARCSPMMPFDGAASTAGEPDGDNETKEKIKREQEASSLRDKIDDMVRSNELMLPKTLETKKDLAEKKAREKQEKWQLLKDEGLCKATIEERRARATKNKAMSKLLAEENRIMTLNRNDMDDITKEWHDMARRDILKRRMLASAGACYSAGDVFSSEFGTNVVDAFSAPVDDFGVGVGTNAGDGFGGGDDLDECGAE